MRISETGDSITVYLKGSIDRYSARGLREDTDTVVQMKKPSVLNLDFSGVSFMDSSGIGYIIGMYRLMRLSGGTVKVVNVPDELAKMMNFTGLGALNIID